MNAINSLLVRLLPVSVFVLALNSPATIQAQETQPQDAPAQETQPQESRVQQIQTQKIPAQEFDASAIYPGAPMPQISYVHAIIKARVPATSTFKHRRLNLNNLSIAVLIAGEAVDSWGTYKNLSHTKWICGNSSAFAGSYDTNVPGSISSLGDVQKVCGVGPAGQQPNWAFDVSRPGYFSEGGWVTQLHLAGDRNYAGVETWNLMNDVGWYLIARRLGARKDWVGKSGPALNFGRGLVHLELGIGNFLTVGHHQNPNTLNLHVPKDSNYTAPRWWGKN